MTTTFILDRLCKECLTSVSHIGERKISPEYILSLDSGEPLFKELVTTILNVTRYIPFDEFYNTLMAVVKRISTPKFHLYFNTSCRKIGSEHWVTALVYPFIKDRVVSVITNPADHSANPQYPILFCDDAIYSGCNLCGKIDYLKNQEQYEFIIMTAYSTKSGMACIISQDFGRGITFIENESLTEYTDIPEITAVIQKVSDVKGIKFDNVMYKALGCNSGCVSPTYFDHKVANDFGSFIGIYLHGLTDFGQLDNRSDGNTYTGSYGLAIQHPPCRDMIRLVESIIRDADVLDSGHHYE